MTSYRVQRWPLPRSAPRTSCGRGLRPGRGRHGEGGLRPADRQLVRHPHRPARPHADAGPDRRAHPRRADRGEPASAGRRAADAARRQRARSRCAPCCIAASPRCATPAAPITASRPRSNRGCSKGHACSSPAQPLSQTGGHGDYRLRTQTNVFCACCSGLSWAARVADGVPDVIKAARDELRKGADHIKIMVSGGVASQPDPLESLQYRIDEIEAAVDEATRWGTYVCAHAYSAKAIERAVTAGVRTIEHGNLIDAPTATLMAERGAYLVPTSGRLRRAEAPRSGLRLVRLQPGEERTRAACRAALAGDRARRRREDRFRLRSARPVAERPLQRVHHSPRGDERAGHHPLGHAGERRDRPPGGQDRRTDPRRARGPAGGGRRSVSRHLGVSRRGPQHRRRSCWAGAS